MAARSELHALIAALRAYAVLGHLDRADQAPKLIEQAKHALSQDRQAAIYEATRHATYEQIADRLGISQKAISKAVTAHRRRLAEQNDA